MIERACGPATEWSARPTYTDAGSWKLTGQGAGERSALASCSLGTLPATTFVLPHLAQSTYTRAHVSPRTHACGATHDARAPGASACATYRSRTGAKA